VMQRECLPVQRTFQGIPSLEQMFNKRLCGGHSAILLRKRHKHKNLPLRRKALEYVYQIWRHHIQQDRNVGLLVEDFSIEYSMTSVSYILYNIYP
jgi:hypothetical protein